MMGASLPPTSCQLVMRPVKMSESWSMVSSLTGLAWLTMTASASMATVNSCGSKPFLRASSISLSFIAREALAMSTVPLISAAMPVPEPPPVTAIDMSGATCR